MYEEGTPRSLWRLGNIVRVIRGSDERIRSAEVR